MTDYNWISAWFSESSCAHVLISNVDLLKNGVIRMETNFKRFDGSYVDLFTEGHAKHERPSHAIITDYGETWSFLTDCKAGPSIEMVSYYAEIYRVDFRHNTLSISCEVSNILPSILTLAQACVSITGSAGSDHERSMSRRSSRSSVSDDLTSTRQTTTTQSEKQRIIIERLRAVNLNFRPEARIEVRQEYSVKVDLLVEAPLFQSAMMLIETSPYDKITSRRVDHAFAIHNDLREANWSGRRISVVDDLTSLEDRNYDSFARLTRVSDLVKTSMVDSMEFWTPQ